MRYALSAVGRRERAGTIGIVAGREVLLKRRKVELWGKYSWQRSTAVRQVLLGEKYSWEGCTAGREKGGWHFRRPAPTNDLIYVYGNWIQLTWLLHINFNCRIFFLLYFRSGGTDFSNCYRVTKLPCQLTSYFGTYYRVLSGGKCKLSINHKSSQAKS